MSFAPYRDWDFYRSVSSRDDVFRERTPEERLEIYADFFDTIVDAQRNQPTLFGDRIQRDRPRSLRLGVNLYAAFLVLDKWNCERDAEDRSS